MERERNQRADAHLEAVGRCLAIVHYKVFHVQQVTELVVGTTGGTARFGICLHGKSAQQQSFYKFFKGLWVVVACDGFGIAKCVGQSVLHNSERQRVDGFNVQCVGQNPIGAGGNLGEQICITAGRHVRRRSGYNICVGHYGLGCRARESLLVAVFCDGSAKCHVSVH